MLGEHWDDDGGIFRFLALVNGRCVGRDQHIEFPESIDDGAAVEAHSDLPRVAVNIIDGADVAVVDLFCAPAKSTSRFTREHPTEGAQPMSAHVLPHRRRRAPAAQWIDAFVLEADVAGHAGDRAAPALRDAVHQVRLAHERPRQRNKIGVARSDDVVHRLCRAEPADQNDGNVDGRLGWQRGQTAGNTFPQPDARKRDAACRRR
jgi:hypothetical protein